MTTTGVGASVLRRAWARLSSDAQDRNGDPAAPSSVRAACSREGDSGHSDGHGHSNGGGRDARGPSHGHVTRRELVWVLLWAAFIMALTCLPYIYAMKTAQGRDFGGFLWGVDEGNVYLTWMRQAAEGRVFFRNQYAPVPERPLFLNLFLQLGGRAAGLLHVDLRVMFHLLRLLGGIFLLLSFYHLVAELTCDRVTRWAALVLASLGSGFGWMVVMFASQSGLHPVDLGQSWQVQPEAVTFLSLLLNGLFTTSMALMCLTFLYGLRALREGDRCAVITGGVCLLVLGNIHTYDVFAVWLVLVGTAGMESRQVGIVSRLKPVALMILIGLPSVLWALYATFGDPAFLAKGLTPTPAFRFVDYVVAYGLVGLLALVGAVVWLRTRASEEPASAPQLPVPSSRFPAIWALANGLVLLIPVSFQRKMIEGLHLPLCILAGFAVSWLAYRMTRRLRERGKHKHAMERIVLAVCAVAVFALPSNALFVSQAIQDLKTNNAGLLAVLQPPIFLEPETVRAMQWLGAHATSEDVVLSSSFMGSYIPTVSRAEVWVGHWAETMALADASGTLPPTAPLQVWRAVGKPAGPVRRDFREQLGLPRAFFATYEPIELSRLLASTPVTLVFYSHWEQSLTLTSDPKRFGDAVQVQRWLAAAEQALQRVYDAGGVRIYRVTRQ